jgi:hypothetical protein
MIEGRSLPPFWQPGQATYLPKLPKRRQRTHLPLSPDTLFVGGV